MLHFNIPPQRHTALFITIVHSKLHRTCPMNGCPTAAVSKVMSTYERSHSYNILMVGHTRIDIKLIFDPMSANSSFNFQTFVRNKRTNLYIWCKHNFTQLWHDVISKDKIHICERNLSSPYIYNWDNFTRKTVRIRYWYRLININKNTNRTPGGIFSQHLDPIYHFKVLCLSMHLATGK